MKIKDHIFGTWMGDRMPTRGEDICGNCGCASLRIRAHGGALVRLWVALTNKTMVRFPVWADLSKAGDPIVNGALVTCDLCAEEAEE